MASPCDNASCSRMVITPSVFTPKTPHFFKIILEDNIREGKLRIPRKFVTKYGDGLSSPVQLMVPDGFTWHVELINSDGDVWLQNGWKAFSEHYSLKHGHFVVFKYEGDCTFQVLIFDMSATEIEYPPVSPIKDWDSDEECQEPDKEESKNDSSVDMSAKEIEYPPVSPTKDCDSDEKCQEPDKEESKNGSSVEILHETPTPPGSRKRQRSRTPSLHPPKIVRRTTSADKGGLCSDNIDREDVSSVEGDPKTMVPSGGHEFGANGRITALQRANAFKSENLFFVVEMQPSYINPGRKVTLPSNFITKCLKEKVGDLTLCTVDGRTWPAKYCRYLTNNKYIKATLHIGWTEFRKDNKLEPGDVCVFELIEETKILLKVVIYRVNEDSSCCSSLGGINSLATCDNERLLTQGSTRSKHHSMRPLTSLEKSRATIRASNFRSENPFFMVVMQPAYLGARSRVYIPYKFTERYVHEKDHVILQVSDGRTWIVKLSVTVVPSGQNKASFCGGWKAFAGDNNLEVGDVCVFELINCNETSFRVSIF